MRTLLRYEIADGCPLADDKIAFSVPIKSIENLSPTLKDIFNKFSVKYFVSFGMFETMEDGITIAEVCSKPFEIVIYK